jgi:HEAT repeat protein
VRFPRTALAIVALSAALAAPASATVWPSSHQRIAQALESGDVSERRSAAAKLLELPPKLAKGLARKALTDGDIEVRLFAARAAAALGIEGAGDDVVAWLQETDSRLRVAACELIEATPTPIAIAALARVLGDTQPAVRKAAAAAMGASGLPDAVSPLLGHLDDGATEVRLEVVRALGRLGDGRAVLPLASKLQDQEPEVRREVSRALGQLGDASAATALTLLLQDASVAVRVQALDALGRLRAQEATAAVAALLSSEEDLEGEGETPSRGPVRDAALAALGRIGTPEAVKLLVGALEEEGPLPLEGSEPAPVRRALVLAGKNAIEGLTATLRGSPTQRLGSAAVLALGALGARDAVPEVVRATQRGVVTLDAGLKALGALRDDRALGFVLEQLEAADPRTRQAAVEVATQLLRPETRDGRAVDVVRARTLDLTAPLGERMALVRLLGRTGSERARDLLLSLIASKPVELRIAVAEALGTLGIGSAAVDDALLDVLDDESHDLRAAAAKAIGRVGKDAAARKLLFRLGVSAEQDRGAIGIGLSGALGRSTDPKLAAEVKQALGVAPASARDALVEGLGRMQTTTASAVLGDLAKSTDSDERRKAAEALGGHGDAEAALLGLLKDPDPAVRADAVWSLGKVGAAATVTALGPLLADLDAAVAGNAAVALAKAAVRAKKTADAAKSLCTALGDYRPYTRAGALTGLRLVAAADAAAGASCDGTLVRHVLRRDRSWRVRLAAARLLRALPSGAGDEPLANARALARCAQEDRDATVAAACGADAPAPDGAHDVMVFVVPDGKTSPAARAPYALVLPDGSMRLGVADRRGAVFERGAPGGRIELAVPAALAE